MDMRSRGEPRISAHTGIRHSSSKTHKISPFLRKIPKLYFSFVLNFCSNLGFLTAMAVISGISSGTLTISRPLVTLRRSRAAVSYISSHQLFRHRPLTSRRLLFRNIDQVQATILQDDEEKLVVDESFKAKTFTGKEPLEEPNMNSSSSSAFESWIIKLEQGVNVFLTDSVIKILDTLYRDRTYARFFVLETIARVPYFAFMSVLHIYETFGCWRRADHLNVHFAESWNEMHHLLIMEV